MADEIETQDVNEQEGGKKKKAFPLKMILIIFGVLVVNAIVVIGVIKFFFADVNHGAEYKTAGEQALHQKKDEFAQFKDNEENFFEKEKERKLLTTGRITTNPANSIENLIIVNLGLEYRIKPDSPEEEFKEDSPLMEKLMVRIKAVVLQRLGSMGVEELVKRRSELPDMFKQDLQPVFNDNQMYLRAVYLNEFLIQ